MHIVRKLQPIFVVVALLLVIFLVRSQWDELRSHRWQLNPWWLAVSGGWLVAAWAMEIQIWRRLLHQVGGRLPYWPAARIWFLSAITRYIPGNIWQPLSMTLLCQQRGIAPEATLTSVVLYQLLILLAATPVAGVYFWSTGNWGLLTDVLQQWTPWLIASGMAPVVIFVVRPAWLIDLVNWMLVKLRRPPLAAELTRRDLLVLLLMAIFDWLLWGASFAALAFALEPYSPAEMLRLAPHLVATYAIAYTVGFVSIVTPSGLGVREGAFYLLLTPILGGGPTTVVALAMRLWTTLGELVAAAVAALFPGRRTTAGETPGNEGELREGLT
jgi:glycosyltransferase 2 family protein